MVAATGGTVSLSGTAFQDVTKPITFRLYGWAAITGTGAFSVNNFQFNGVVSCAIPQIPILPEINLNCTATSFEVNWPIALHASNYFVNIASDSDFKNNLEGYQNKELGNTISESVNGLRAGSIYYVRLKSANSCGESVFSKSIKVAPPETIYNGVWSNGVPNISKQARFASDFNLNADFEACSCQVDDGVAVHVDSDVVLRLENGLNVLGTLTFENNASLIQANNVAGLNSGNIIYKRLSQFMNKNDYTYWSSPVSGQTLKALVPNTVAYYSWGTDNWISEPSSKVMYPPGRGYIILVPKAGVYTGTYPETVSFPYREPVQFVGVPNNGPYSLNINGVDLYNLIGNPYPSALSADAFLQENCVDHLRVEGTLRFWTHNTKLSATGYASADYAYYNFTGGTGTGTASTKPGFSDAAPLGNIATGQSFFVISKGPGPVVFNNNMRVGAGGKNSQFYRGTKSKTEAVEKHRIWLNLTNAGGAFKQMLVGYVSGATEGYDSAFDGESFDGNTFVDFYSISESRNFAIQGRGLPFDAKDKVPLGYSTTITGTFEISIDRADGSLSDQPVYVEDKMTSIIHNLKNGPYSFSTAKGMFNDRLVLRYSDKAADPSLGNQSVDEKQKGLVVSVKSHKIKINSFDQVMDNVMVYDLKGSLLYEKNQLNENEFTIPNFNSSDQFLIVMVQLSGGKWVTKEIAFKKD